MNLTLRQFVARAVADDRILFGDLKRLERDILPARITCREEAEALLFLDSAVHKADRDWTVYLTTNVRDFVVWGLEPAGAVDRDKAAWLSGALSCASPSRTARVLIGEIMHEARKIDAEALVQLGVARPSRRARRQAHNARRGEAGAVARHARRWPAGEPASQAHQVPLYAGERSPRGDVSRWGGTDSEGSEQGQ